MSVDRSVSRGPCEALLFFIRNVAFLWEKPLGQSEVYDEYFMWVLLADEKVVGLDVPVDELLGVNELNDWDHLIANHEHSLEGEFLAHIVEMVLNTLAQALHDYEVEIVVGSLGVEGRYALGMGFWVGIEVLIKFGFEE